MAEAKKTKIKIDTEIDMFGEAKGKPAWFAARPEAEKMVQNPAFKRTIEVDPRKWKEKVIKDGMYAVARYDLKIFATVLSGLEKEILKARPKERQKLKFVKNDKGETMEEAAALDKALKDLKKIYTKTSSSIKDKVSLALDDVESDKGDNKRALAKGKKALEQFHKLDTSKLFAKPTAEVDALLDTLNSDLKKSGDGDAASLKKAMSALQASRKGFEATGKTAQNVIKYLLDEGAKMAKDTKSSPEMQNVGKLIISNRVKPDLELVSDNVDDFEDELDEVEEFLKSKNPSSVDAKRLADTFVKSNRSKDGDLKDAVTVVKKVSDQFKKAAASVKK